MWIQVRSIDGKKTVRIDDLSKLTKIEELRDRLTEPFEASPDRQRLYFRGKQLVDGHTLFDYNVGLNELIQLMVRPALKITSTENKQSVEESHNGYVSSEDDNLSDKENKKPDTPVEEKPTSSNTKDNEGSIYKVGDIIDARDATMGAWFEANIVAVKRKVPERKQDCNSNLIVNSKDVADKKTDSQQSDSTTDSAIESMDCESDDVLDKRSVKKTPVTDKVLQSIDLKNIDDGFEYQIVFEGYDENDPCSVSSKDLRPRAKTIIKFEDVKIGQKVMVNYNYDEPEQRGYWYDGVVTEKRNTRTIKELKATIYFGADLMPLNDCNLLFVHEVFDIEKPGTQINTSDVLKDPTASPVKRQNKPECDHCQDNPKRKCRHCACCICGGKNDPDKQILCDECDKAYHMSCMDPPMESLPEDDEWYCPGCKTDSSEVVKAGEKLKQSKKKSKMASATATTSRDWGKGMACVGRTKVCSIVPSNHFGPIPGVEVGTCWKFRVQVSEAGVHRPHVAGIHGREEDGAFSIVLSGGYEDDKDDGDKFTYTGSGGRDLSGNKRTAEQSCDQTLTRMNKALAKNCNAPINCKDGAEAKDWRNGKPVRVVRNCKGSKHSKYAPEEGNRYDGIYKIVKYWPNKGKSGFLVWRYLLKRDDETPAPWTKEGKKRIDQLGLTMQYPEGYLEAQEEKERQKEDATPAKGKNKKRKAEDMDSPPSSPEKVKKAKVAEYKIESPVKKLIKEDTDNQKLWEEALEETSEGGQKFLAKIEELFMCICCQEIVYKPVTTSCSHNFCKTCIQRSFKAEVYTCPYCRTDLGKDYKMPCNKTLSTILLKFFPGYDAGRS